MPQEKLAASGSISGQTGVELKPGENLETFLGDAEDAQQREAEKAKYKIEIHFSKHRSPNRTVESPSMLLIWESGKKYHGGGDQKMYWCGYDDCGKPFSCDNFAYMHVVCPKCHKEMFLDPKAREAHAQDMMDRRLDPRSLGKVRDVVGEKLFNVVPADLAAILEKTWRELDGDADIYIKFSPHDIRYHKDANPIAVAEQLRRHRVARRPLMYSLKNIIKDLHAGATLHARFLALITS